MQGSPLRCSAPVPTPAPWHVCVCLLTENKSCLDEALSCLIIVITVVEGMLFSESSTLHVAVDLC